VIGERVDGVMAELRDAATFPHLRYVENPERCPERGPVGHEAMRPPVRVTAEVALPTPGARSRPQGSPRGPRLAANTVAMAFATPPNELSAAAMRNFLSGPEQKGTETVQKGTEMGVG